MAAAPITLSTTLVSADPDQEVLARLRRMHWGSSVRLDQPDSTTLRVTSGSKLRYRLLGAWSGSEHLPLTLVLRAHPHGNGTSVDFSLTSAAGWHLVQSPLGRDAYQARFDEFTAALEAEGITRNR